MGKKKSFLVKKNAERFRLIPESARTAEPRSEHCQATAEQIEEQHKFGVFFDDDYDYLQHMRDRNEKNVLLSLNEESTVVAAPQPSLPSFPLDSNTYAKKRVVFDDDIDRALEGDVDQGEGDALDDNFVSLAGGALDDSIMRHRETLDSDNDEEDIFNQGYQDYDMEDEEEEDSDISPNHECERDVDAAFESLLEADYGEEQMGELEGEAVDISGGIEPHDARMKTLIGEKRALPLYDEKVAKEYVRARMAVLEEKGSEDEEEVEVEVDESTSKRMKWDCESFATQYTNIYNHPSLIKEGLSRRALKKMEKDSQAAAMEEESEEDEDDDISVCTTATTGPRPRDETTAERRVRKAAVREQRRSRRAEKKQNREAFAAESRQAVASRAGRLNGLPIQ